MRLAAGRLLLAVMLGFVAVAYLAVAWQIVFDVKIGATVTMLTAKDVDERSGGRGRRGRRRPGAEVGGDRRDHEEQEGQAEHAAISGAAVLPRRIRFFIRPPYAPARSIEGCAC